MFRVIVKFMTVRNEVYCKVDLLAFRDGHFKLCGVLVLYPTEWSEFERICQAFCIPIEVMTHEAVSLDVAETAVK